MSRLKKGKWYWALLLQGLSFFTVSVICIFLPFLFENGAPVIEKASQFVALPVIGGVSAYVSTRKGLNNYVAIVAPPILMPVAYQLLTGAAPYYFGGVFLCALVSIIGAAAGEVVNMRENARK